jgi:signal transduction histidine kinase
MFMNANLTLLKKGLILIAIPLAFQLVFLGLVLATQWKVSQAQDQAIHTKNVIARVESAYRRLIEGRSAIQSLILTGDVARYTRFEPSLREVPRAMGDLIVLVSDNPDQLPRARAVAEGATGLIAWQDEVARLYRGDRRDEARALVTSPDGPGRIDDLRAEVDGFRREEERLDRERLDRLRWTTRFQLAVMLVGGAASVAGSFLVLGVFARGISRRFAVLSDNARRLADGQELASPLPGRDEIAQLDRVFHSMARSLAEKNRENELFIYSVSHDLRSPLVNLQGFSQELGFASKELRALLADPTVPEPVRKRGVGVVDRDVADAIHFIQTAVSRLSVIIDALLRLSRAGRVEYRYQAVDVGETVRRVIESLGQTIAERKARVTAGPLPAAWGDPTAVEQVFANLVGNAVHYLDPDRPGEVEVGVLGGDSPSNGTGHRTYYVKDNGLGIPEAGLPKMFMAFQRFHESRSRGEGIGLALVRKIVERHGGKIWVESTPGVGSTFYLDLPIPPREDHADSSILRVVTRAREAVS